MTRSRNIKRLLPLVLITFAATIESAIGQTATPTVKSDTILDSLIAVVIILFILSTINEKITQLIRKYSPFIRPGDKLRKTKATTFFRNINKKSLGDDRRLDKLIEREVTALSFNVGLAIAILFRVDIIKMFISEDPRKVLFYSNEVVYSPLEKILFPISLALSAFFLTFGSKFFHDLLDTLYQAKNLKRKLNSDATYEADNIQQFDEHLEKNSSSIIEIAIAQNEQYFKDPPLSMPPMQGKMYQDGKLVDSIDVHLKGTNRGNIPAFVQAKLEKGQIIKVPVNVIYDVEIAKAQSSQGNTVANGGSVDFKGTICCKVLNENNESLLITCSHVMNSGSGKNDFGPLPNPIPAVIDNNQDGNFIWGLCNEKFDIAAIKPADQNFKYTIAPKKERALTSSDMLTTKVKVFRQNSNSNAGKISEGTVVNYSCPVPVPIKYSNGEFGVTDLIILSKITVQDDVISYATLSIEGDSGACVYDQKNRPIGMIIAGNSKFSYAISIVEILKQLKATLTH